MTLREESETVGRVGEWGDIDDDDEQMVMAIQNRVESV